MEYQNGQYISAYTENDIIFEGKVYTRNDGTKVVLNENKKWIPINKLKLIRVIESEETDISSLVDTDLADKDMEKLGGLDDTALDKLGDTREKELISNGIKINDGDYKNSFVSKIKASKVAADAEAGNISDSAALEKYKQSKDIDIEMRIKRTLKENLNDDDFDFDFFDETDDDYDFTDDISDDEFDLMDAAEAFKEIYDSSEDSDFEDADDDLFDSDFAESDIPETDIEDKSQQIEDAIDEYADSVTIYKDSEMFEYVCNKFGFDSKKLLKENNYSIADSILSMVERI